MLFPRKKQKLKLNNRGSVPAFLIIFLALALGWLVFRDFISLPKPVTISPTSSPSPTPHLATPTPTPTPTPKPSPKPTVASTPAPTQPPTSVSNNNPPGS